MRDCSPATRVTAPFGTEKSFANNRMMALFALPSNGGAVIATFSESPCIPQILFLEERG